MTRILFGGSARSIATRYMASLAGAHLITAAEVMAIVWSLSGQAFIGTRATLTQPALLLLVAVVVVGTMVAAAGGYLIVAPSLAWIMAEVDPDHAQRRGATRMVHRQSGLLLAIWATSAAVLLAVDFDGGYVRAAAIGIAAAFGAASTIGTGLLFTQRILRQTAGATKDDFATRTFPGIRSRLVMMWVFNSAMPSSTIALLLVCKANGWFIPRSASLDIPVMVLSVVAVGLGLRALILVSRSIADPVREVVNAMAEIEHGQIGRTVGVYDHSDIGRLQRGFNRMVAGLLERDRIRDLFDRHVGPAVVRRAIKGDDSLSGEVHDVAILFIDLAGSTRMTATLSPPDVVDILNGFFQIVVAAVDERGGWINQFQGDAALVVFGRGFGAAAALGTARALSADLRQLPIVDFGIGVSAGPVFAGNIGAENRHVFTVIGDPVNEAARLADTAKRTSGRAMASSAAITRAGDSERRQWVSHGLVTLRGRLTPTQVSVPHGEDAGCQD